jgi:purine-nucleoside phosphorylase
MGPSSLFDKIQEAKQFLQARISIRPKLAIVFGSGLAGEFLTRAGFSAEIPFEEIPHFGKPTVAGHGGRLYAGLLKDVPLLVSDGRFHYYEGYSMAQVVFPIRVYASLGVEEILLTNASGGLNPRLKVGDLMIVKDHLNLTGRNPLRGSQDDRLGPRFVDMTEAYDPALIKSLLRAGRRLGTAMPQGVYAGILGPSYETPAEIRMYRKLGGDAIGMSTVPEVIAARHAGLKTAVISCITNVLMGPKKALLSHEKVVEEAAKIQYKLARLLEEYLCDRN